jgi:hypothetical protein
LVLLELHVLIPAAVLSRFTCCFGCVALIAAARPLCVAIVFREENRRDPEKPEHQCGREDEYHDDDKTPTHNLSLLVFTPSSGNEEEYQGEDEQAE